ncbi:GrpB family protein [Arthrobacter sp. TMN-49]
MRTESDDHLDAVLIGGREERPIVIVEYDPEWHFTFDALALAIKEAVGEGALSIEHIGSTSIPGLAAKPIIDILMTVEDVEDETAYLERLQTAGFVLRVRETGHRMLRTPAKNVHLHLFSAEDPAVSNYQDLRDWLRVDERDRALYVTTKKGLAQQQWADVNYYAEAKTDVISEILSRARMWRRGMKVTRN